jgi:Rad3-related DNA helicase
MIACNVRASDNMTSSLLDGANNENNGGKKEKFPTKQSVLQWISSIARDPMSILLRREDLIEIVNKPELPFTVIEPLILALSDEELLDSSRTDKVYAAVIESGFMSNPRNFKSYILRLTNSTDPSNDEVRPLKYSTTILT